MGAKKKAGKKKAAKSDVDEEDKTVHNFMKYYRKKAAELNVEVVKNIKELYDLYDGGEMTEPGIQKFHIWSELGWGGTRAIMDSLREAVYPHCTSIRLWQTNCEDEGVRSICQFIELGKGVAVLELLDNRITPLGCEFLSKSLHPIAKPTIQILKLDHNNFGSEGMKCLSEGLAINPLLRILSLQYCSIDAEAAEAVFQILIYTRSALEDVNLSGNMLGNEGIIKVFQGTSVAKSLKKIWLGDNQFNDEEDVLKAIMFCWVKNTRLGKYDIKHNIISTDGLTTLTDCLEKEATHVFDVEIPERITDKEVFKRFSDQLKANKPKKGRKGKGKKKKKK